jgi:hypothetical protein
MRSRGGAEVGGDGGVGGVGEEEEEEEEGADGEGDVGVPVGDGSDLSADRPQAASSEVRAVARRTVRRVAGTSMGRP